LTKRCFAAVAAAIVAAGLVVIAEEAARVLS
jgi:hypothetical protein